jgi:hypothetical protein
MWVVASLVAFLLAVPRTSSADVWDLIWSMSGPQFTGPRAECWIALSGTVDHCNLFLFPVGASKATAGAATNNNLWFSLSGGLYFSTGKNSKDTNSAGQPIDIDYEFGREWMAAFEPMLMMKSPLSSWRMGDKFKLYHGVGFTADYFFTFTGDHDNFPNVGLKLRPIGVIINDRVNISYNLRIYPNKFASDWFGKAPVATGSQPEAVHSLSFGINLYK